MSIFGTESYNISGIERGIVAKTTASIAPSFIEQLRKSAGENDRTETSSEKRSRENAEIIKSKQMSDSDNLKHLNNRNEGRTADDLKAFERSEKTKIGINEIPRESRKTPDSMSSKSSENAPDSTGSNIATRIPIQGNIVSAGDWNDRENGFSYGGGVNIDTGSGTVSSGTAGATDSSGIHQDRIVTTPEAHGEIGNLQVSQNSNARVSAESNRTNILLESIIFGGGPLIAQQPLRKSSQKSDLIEETDEGDSTEEPDTESTTKFSKELGDFSKESNGGNTRLSFSGPEFNSVTKKFGPNGGINPEIAAALAEAAENLRDSQKPEAEVESETKVNFVQKLTEQNLAHEVVPGEVPAGTRDRSRLMQRIASAIQAGGRKDGSTRMKLAPEALGSIKIDLRCENGIMNVLLEVETEEAKRALLEGLEELEERLASMGVVIESFEVKLDSDGPGETLLRKNLDIYEQKTDADDFLSNAG